MSANGEPDWYYASLGGVNDMGMRTTPWGGVELYYEGKIITEEEWALIRSTIRAIRRLQDDTLLSDEEVDLICRTLKSIRRLKGEG